MAEDIRKSAQNSQERLELQLRDGSGRARGSPTPPALAAGTWAALIGAFAGEFSTSRGLNFAEAILRARDAMASDPYFIWLSTQSQIGALAADYLLRPALEAATPRLRLGIAFLVLQAAADPTVNANFRARVDRLEAWANRVWVLEGIAQTLESYPAQAWAGIATADDIDGVERDIRKAIRAAASAGFPRRIYESLRPMAIYRDPELAVVIAHASIVADPHQQSQFTSVGQLEALNAEAIEIHRELGLPVDFPLDGDFVRALRELSAGPVPSYERVLLRSYYRPTADAVRLEAQLDRLEFIRGIARSIGDTVALEEYIERILQRRLESHAR